MAILFQGTHPHTGLQFAVQESSWIFIPHCSSPERARLVCQHPASVLGSPHSENATAHLALLIICLSRCHQRRVKNLRLTLSSSEKIPNALCASLSPQRTCAYINPVRQTRRANSNREWQRSSCNASHHRTGV